MARDTEAHASAPGSGDRTGRAAVAALFARRQAAYDNLDSATLAADYAEDAVIDSPFSGRHTKAQAAHNLNLVFSAFMDMKMVTEALIVDGDHVAQMATIEGTNIGGLFGIDPSGKKFKISAVFVYELRDGLIVRERRVYDFTGVLVQVGVLKAKPA